MEKNYESSLLILLTALLVFFLGRAIIVDNNVANEVYKQEIIELEDEIECLKYKIDSLENIISKNPKVSNWMPLVEAMIHVESRGNENAVGKQGDYGVLQIRKIMIDECNNILKSKGIDLQYSHVDAFDRDKSIQIFHIIADKYAPDGDYETMARIWNGGPNAKYPNTKAYDRTTEYWEKVKNALIRLS